MAKRYSRLRKVRLKHVSLVDRPAEPGADVVLAKRDADMEFLIYKRNFTAQQRHDLAAKGQALEDGSYPIAGPEDLGPAATLARSGHGNVAAAKKLIARMATKFGVKNPLEDDVQKDSSDDGTQGGDGTDMTPDEAVDDSDAEATGNDELEKGDCSHSAMKKGDNYCPTCGDKNVSKGQPSSSDVHSDKPLGEEDKRKKLMVDGTAADDAEDAMDGGSDEEAEGEIDVPDKKSSQKMKKNIAGDDKPVTLNSIQGETPEDTMPDIAKGDFDSLPEWVQKYVTELEDRVIALEDVSKNDASADTDSIEEVLKGITDPAVRAIVKRQHDELEATKADAARTHEIAKAERETRINGEMTAIAKSMPHIAESESDLASILKRAFDADDEHKLFADVRALLEKADAAIAKSGLFDEVGSGLPGGEALSTLDAKVAELRKSDSSLTREQAVAKALDEDPSLYTKMIEEG